LLVHIFQGLFIDYIIQLPCPEELQKVDSAFAVRRLARIT
jgi:hypothetical protein